MTEPIARYLREAGITSSATARGSLREELVRLKDKTEKLEIPGIIYSIGCAGSNGVECPAEYVGESERTAEERGREHFSTSRQATGAFKSAVMQHAHDQQHHFRKEDFNILSREPNYHARGIREAIFIRGLSPSINREDARHTLPHNYDSIIRNSVKKPIRPETHKPSEPRLHTAPRGPGRPRSQSEDTTAPKTMSVTAEAAATAAATTATAARPRQPPTHSMVTRLRTAHMQEDRGTAN